MSVGLQCSNGIRRCIVAGISSRKRDCDRDAGAGGSACVAMMKSPQIIHSESIK